MGVKVSKKITMNNGIYLQKIKFISQSLLVFGNSTLTNVSKPLNPFF